MILCNACQTPVTCSAGSHCLEQHIERRIAAAVAAERERCFRLVMDAPNECVDEYDTEDTFDAMKAMAVSVASKIRSAAPEVPR